jgi:hypothetical protein
MDKTLAVALGLTLFTCACGNPTPPSSPTPVAPTITETFSGTLTVLGSNSHPFTVQQVGGIRVTLISVVPAAAVGVGIGTPASGVPPCSVISSVNAVFGVTVQVSGTATATGSFCAAVFDPGNLVEPVTYTITVVHS